MSEISWTSRADTASYLTEILIGNFSSSVNNFSIVSRLLSFTDQPIENLCNKTFAIESFHASGKTIAKAIQAKSLTPVTIEHETHAAGLKRWTDHKDLIAWVRVEFDKGGAYNSPNQNAMAPNWKPTTMLRSI